jgi:hypothetical protein
MSGKNRGQLGFDPGRDSKTRLPLVIDPTPITEKYSTTQ